MFLNSYPFFEFAFPITLTMTPKKFYVKLCIVNTNYSLLNRALPISFRALLISFQHLLTDISFLDQQLSIQKHLNVSQVCVKKVFNKLPLSILSNLS